MTYPSPQSQMYYESLREQMLFPADMAGFACRALSTLIAELQHPSITTTTDFDVIPADDPVTD